jgi:hypothetical protein
MPALEGMLHLLNEAFEKEVGAMLWEFIGSDQCQIGEKPDTGESHIELPCAKAGSMFDIATCEKI